ncbi:MAG TPA: hypothetical protein VF516_30240, partial [Kofleriaceae bacterium]
HARRKVRYRRAWLASSGGIRTRKMTLPYFLKDVAPPVPYGPTCPGRTLDIFNRLSLLPSWPWGPIDLCEEASRGAPMSVRRAGGDADHCVIERASMLAHRRSAPRRDLASIDDPPAVWPRFVCKLATFGRCCE